MITFKKKIYNVMSASKLEEIVAEHMAQFPKMANWSFQGSEEATNDTEHTYDDVGRASYASKEFPELSKWDLDDLWNGTAGARIVLVWLAQTKIIHIGNYLIRVSY